MATQFTQGKFARAICDRCGHEVKYQDLKDEWTGLRVCKDCWDPKTALEFPSNFPVDPESLRDPRPDNDVESGDGLIGVAQTVGLTFAGFELEIELGDVTVTMA